MVGPARGTHVLVTFLLYLLLTAGGSVSIGVHVLRLLRIDRDLCACGAAALLALCMQSAFVVMAGAYSLGLAGAGIGGLQLAAIGALLVDGSVSRGWQAWRRRERPELGRFAKVCLAAVAVVLAGTFVSALAPATAWDAGVAHLAVAERYASANRIAMLPGNNYCAYPQLMQALYARALAFMTQASDTSNAKWPSGSERLAVVTSWMFAVLACVAAFALGKTIGGPTCGTVAAAVLATAPIFSDQAASPSIDLAFSATVLASLYAVLRWHEGSSWKQLVFAAALAGSGCGIRHTGYLVAALLLVGVLIAARRRRTLHSLCFLFVVALFAAPWLWHSWRISGNPVYPFFASRLSNGALPDVDVAAIGTHSSVQGVDALRLLAFPWSMTMNPAHYGGWGASSGVAWLALGLIGAAVGGRRACALAGFSGAGLTAIFFFQRFARYALPFTTPMMVLAAVPYERLPKLRPIILASLLVSFAVGIVPAVASAVMRAPAAFGFESRHDYLIRRVERYSAMDWIAQNTDPDAVVLSLDPRGYYFQRDTYTNFEALKGIANDGGAAQRAWLAARGIDYVFYPEKYVQDSPAFRETGVGAMVDAWRADREHFVLVKEFDLPNPREGGTERVEIYEFEP